MHRGKSLIDWERAGAELAELTSEEQVLFFKAFLKECLSWGTRLQVEQQFAGINSELTADEREALSMLGYSNET